MTRRVRHLSVLAAAFAVLALPASAAADPTAVVRDCAADGTIDGKHSDADRRAALSKIPADLDEYSDCRAVIAASIGGGVKATAAGNGGGGGADGGSGGAVAGTAGGKGAPKTAAERAAAERRRAATELALGERRVGPRSAGVLKASETANGMPTPVLLALIALGLLGIAGTLLLVSRRKPGMAAALRRGRFSRASS